MASEATTLICESCEASIPVRAGMAGKKIECPKCKLRFVAPADRAEPAAKSKAPAKSTKRAVAEDGDDEPKTKSKSGKGGKAKAKSGGGNGKVIIGAVCGVLALVGLIIGLVVVIGGGGSKDNAKASTPAPINKGGSGTGGVTPGTGLAPTGPGGGGGTPNVTAGLDEIEPSTPVVAPPPKPKAKPKPSEIDSIKLSNLLPNESKTIFHVRMDEVVKNANILRTALFDKATADLFDKSLKFKYTDISELIHTYVGGDRDPFCVIRTKVDLEESNLSKPNMDTTLPDNGTIKGKWTFRILNSNPFVQALSQSVSIPELLGLSLSPAAQAKPPKARTFAICLYDTRTLIIAEKSVMERYLTDLSAEGYPDYKTDFKEPEVIVPPSEPSGPGGPMGPGGPPGGGRPAPGGGKGNDAQAPGTPGGPGPITPSTGGGSPPIVPGGPMTPGGPRGPGGATGGGRPQRPKKALTSNPYFRTVDTLLKKAMNQLEDDEKDTTAAVYVEIVDQRMVNGLDPRAGTTEGQTSFAVNLLQKARVVGVAVTKLTEKKASIVGYIDYTSDELAAKSVENDIKPALGVIQLLYTLRMRDTLEVRDLNDPNISSSNQGGFTGAPGGFPGGPSGFPSPSMPGGPNGGGSGSGPPGPIRPGGVPGGGGGGGGKDSSSPASPSRPGDAEDAQGPGIPGPIRPGTGVGPPGGIPGPITPGTGGGPGGPPIGPGPEGGFPGSGGAPAEFTGSRIDISHVDSVVTLTAELNWKSDFYTSVIESSLNRTGALLRGQIGMFSGDYSLETSLAASTVDGKTSPGIVSRALAAPGEKLPQGATMRSSNGGDRRLPGSAIGLPYSPDHRCSFFGELIRYMDNKGSIASKIEPSPSINGWYQGSNLAAAEAWIPELLVPDYPQSAWRANSDLIVDGRSVGATNYVGVSGLGLDSARLNPKNPADAKKVGMTGYEFGSKAEDVTDGMSNTIYLIQVPPGHQRPWLAGGGATLQGVDEQGAEPAKPFLVKRSDGSRATTVLMGDGSVRTVREGVDPAVFRAMATRAGGEKIADLEKSAPNKASELKGKK